MGNKILNNMSVVTRTNFRTGREYPAVVFEGDNLSETNLRTIFSKSYDNQAYLVDANNCIYLATNLINGKVYVGQAKYFWSRWGLNRGFSHKVELRFDYLTAFSTAVIKYKSRNFKLEVLEKDLDPSELNNREIYWIKYFNSFGSDGYNMNEGGTDNSHIYTSKIINAIISRFQLLKDNNIPVTRYNYLYALLGKSQMSTHVYRVFDWWELLKARPEWKDEYESLFNEFYELGLPARYQKLNSRLIARMMTNVWYNLDNLTLKGLDWSPYNYYYHGVTNKRPHQIFDIIVPNIEDFRHHMYWTNDVESIFRYFQKFGVPEFKVDDNQFYRFTICNDELNKLSRTHRIKAIYSHFEYLKSKGLKVTAFNLQNYSDDFHIFRFLENVVCYLPAIRKDERWTDEMERVFSVFENYDYYHIPENL